MWAYEKRKDEKPSASSMPALPNLRFTSEWERYITSVGASVSSNCHD
jgi:hypothetical protein